jgi:hypothetical protein
MVTLVLVAVTISGRTRFEILGSLVVMLFQATKQID